MKPFSDNDWVIDVQIKHATGDLQQTPLLTVAMAATRLIALLNVGCLHLPKIVPGETRVIFFSEYLWN